MLITLLLQQYDGKDYSNNILLDCIILLSPNGVMIDWSKRRRSLSKAGRINSHEGSAIRLKIHSLVRQNASQTLKHATTLPTDHLELL